MSPLGHLGRQNYIAMNVLWVDAYNPILGVLTAVFWFNQISILQVLLEVLAC